MGWVGKRDLGRRARFGSASEMRVRSWWVAGAQRLCRWANFTHGASERAERASSTPGMHARAHVASAAHHPTS